MKTVYVSPETISINFLSQSMQMQTTSPYANPQGDGGTPILGPTC